MKTLVTFLFALLLLGNLLAQNNNPYDPKLLIPYKMNGKWGYADTLGKVLCVPQYDSAGFYEVWQNTHAIVKKNNKFGIIDQHFNFVISPKYKLLNGTNCYLKEDLKFLQIGKGKRWGVITVGDKRIIPAKYDQINFNYLQFGVIAVKKADKFALFSLTGERITGFIFDNFSFGIFGGGNAEDLLGQVNEDYFLIKPDKTVVPAPEKPKKHKVKTSEPTTPTVDKPETEKATLYKKSLEIKEKYGLDSVYVDRPLNSGPARGKLVYLLVSKNGRKGIWNVKYNTVNFVDYDDIYAIHVYYQEISKKYGFIELLYVQKNGKWGVINEEGVTQLPFEYDGFGKITDTYAETRQKNKSGAVTYFTYYPPIACKYDRIDFFKQLEVTQTWAFDLYKITINGKEGYVGENGVEYFNFGQ